MKIAIGKQVCCHSQSMDHYYECVGSLMGYWLANIQPPGDEVTTYTGLDLNNLLCQSIWKPEKIDRAILQMSNGEYMIVPMGDQMFMEIL